MEELDRMFVEYKRLGGSLNKRGRATGGLWLKWPTDLLGMDRTLGDWRRQLEMAGDHWGPESHRLRGTEPMTLAPESRK